MFDLLVSPNQYEKKPIVKLGEGVTGEVFRVRDKTTKKLMAMKILSLPELINEDSKQFLNEVSNITTCIHPSLLQVISLSIDSPMFFITEYKTNGSLNQLLDKVKSKEIHLLPFHLLIISLGISCGMNYLHQRGICHGNLNPRNIMIDSNFYPYIADFGFPISTEITYRRSIPETINFSSPEIIDWIDNVLLDNDNPPIFTSTDVFSYGLLLYYIFTLEKPISGIIVNTFDNIDPIIHDLIIRCIDNNPSNRPSFSEISTLLLNSEMNGSQSPEFIKYKEIMKDAMKSEIIPISEISLSERKVTQLNKKPTKKYTRKNKTQVVDIFELNRFLPENSEEYQMKANFNLGLKFKNGLGVPKDYSKAFEYLEKSAQSGCRLAYRHLADLYKMGLGCEQNDKKAFECLFEAAKSADPQSLHMLGLMYFFGWGTEINYSKAFECFKKGAKGGISLSSHMMGIMYRDGCGCEINYQKSLEAFKIAEKENDPDTLHNLGLMYLQGLGTSIDYQKAFDYFTKASDAKNTDSYYFLGVMNFNGQGIKKDIPKGIEWLKKSADVGNHIACQFLGNLYLKGQDVQKDPIKAEEYLKKAELSKEKAEKLGNYKEIIEKAISLSSCTNEFDDLDDHS